MMMMMMMMMMMTMMTTMMLMMMMLVVRRSGTPDLALRLLAVWWPSEFMNTNMSTCLKHARARHHHHHHHHQLHGDMHAWTHTYSERERDMKSASPPCGGIRLFETK
eukprot:5863626-Karenia_brevis.AAC.1